MDKKLLLATLITGATFFAVGCGDLLSGLDFNFGDWLGNEESSLDVREASILGELGQVAQMESRSVSFDPGYDSSDYTSFNITGAAPQGEIMQIIEIDGGIYHPMLQTAGTVISNDCSDTRTDNDPPLMRVTGCSDSDGDGWEYDEPCEEVTVEVEEDPENPEVLVYTVTGTFPDIGDEPHEVVSRFAVPRQDGVRVPDSTVDASTRDEWVLGQVQAPR